MQLVIKTVGPIRKGSINLDRELIIFTGPNNTGKSYLTYLIHAISQYKSLGIRASINKEIISIFEKSTQITNAIDNEADINVSEAISDSFPIISKIITKTVKANITKVFASQAVKADFSLDLGKLRLKMNKDSINYITVSNSNNTVTHMTKDGNTFVDELNVERYKTIKNFAFQTLLAIADICTEITISKRTYFFPAERTAINLFAKHITSTKAEIKDELDSEVIGNMTDEELGQRLRAQVKAAPKYPYALRDYINFVNNFKKSNEESKFSYIADNIEIILAGGRIHLDEFDQLIFTPSGSKSALELHLSSSLVKSLSYLILYLRYTAKHGDQIIIDEPELNLHPDLQVAIARIIAEMVNAGLKVIISTHSDYLIKELNNIILLGELNKREQHKVFAKEKGFSEDELLTKDQVGAYFLQGGKITPINLEENGLVVPTINEAIRRVDGLAEELYLEMEG